MKMLGSFLALIVMFWLCAAPSDALTVDEVIKLKRAGVSDSTIELLIQRSGDARSAGVWRQDGWIVHSTEHKFPDTPQVQIYPGGYPMAVYPQVFSGRGRRPR
jgi:hypothetical protein